LGEALQGVVGVSVANREVLMSVGGGKARV